MTNTHTSDEGLPHKKKQVSDIEKAQQLCRHGFHDWIEKEELQFDEAQGMKVPVLKCSRCGKERFKHT